LFGHLVFLPILVEYNVSLWPVVGNVRRDGFRPVPRYR
jgi:hypothetical protein